MFFRHLVDWSNKKLYITFIGILILFIFMVLIAPTIVIGFKYQLWKPTGEYKLTAVGLITAVVIAIVGVGLMNFLIGLMPQHKHWQQVIKFSIQGVINCIVPLLFIWILNLLKKNFSLGYDTAMMCLGFILAGIFIYYTSLVYLITEIKLRTQAANNVDVKRREKYY